jgi:membrane-bound ClpP family serine protease
MKSESFYFYWFLFIIVMDMIIIYADIRTNHYGLALFSGIATFVTAIFLVARIYKNERSK